MQTDVIIQARMGSTRFPGKVLKKLSGISILQRVINQSKKIAGIQNIIIATTTNPKDKEIIDFCQKKDLLFFAGSENDVLDRYIKTANKFGSEIIVRATADNPFLDFKTIQKLIKKHIQESNDYTFSLGFPLGSSGEIFSKKALEIASKSKNPIHHEHLGTFFLDNIQSFQISSLKAPKALSFPSLRLTIDTNEDFKTAQNILDHIGEGFDLKKIINLVNKNPELLENTQIKQNYPTENIKNIFQGKNPFKN